MRYTHTHTHTQAHTSAAQSYTHKMLKQALGQSRACHVAHGLQTVLGSFKPHTHTHCVSVQQDTCSHLHVWLGYVWHVHVGDLISDGLDQRVDTISVGHRLCAQQRTRCRPCHHTASHFLTVSRANTCATIQGTVCSQEVAGSD